LGLRHIDPEAGHVRRIGTFSNQLTNERRFSLAEIEAMRSQTQNLAVPAEAGWGLVMTSRNENRFLGHQRQSPHRRVVEVGEEDERIETVSVLAEVAQ
jgi:hypothetical protein